MNHQPLKRGQAGSIPALDEIKRGLDDPSFIWLEMTRGFRQKTYVLIEDAEVRLSGLWVPHPRQDLKPFRTVLVWYLEADPYIYDGQAMSIGQPLPVEEAPLLHFSRSCDVVYCSLRGDDCEVIAYAEKRAAVVSAKTNGLYSCMVPKVEDAPLSFFDKMVRHYRYDLRGWGHVLLGRTLFSAWLTCFYLVAIIAVTRFDRRFDGSAPMLLLGFLGMFSAARVVVFVACSADYPDSRHPGLISAQSALVGLLFLLSLTGRVRGSVRYWWRVARGSAVRFRYAFAEASWEIDRLAIAELDEADIVLPPMSLAYTFLTYDPESVQAHSLWLEPEAPRPYVLALPYSSANRGVPFFNLASDGILDGPMSEGESPMNSHEEMRRAGRKRRSRRKRRHKTQLSLVTTKEEGSPT
ncbi:MAG: hypothetical protein H6712_24370 [Myxococcales bacterium]|nr:hypothetical protein [Myxococcales bacterium]